MQRSAAQRRGTVCCVGVAGDECPNPIPSSLTGSSVLGRLRAALSLLQVLQRVGMMAAVIDRSKQHSARARAEHEFGVNVSELQAQIKPSMSRYRVFCIVGIPRAEWCTRRPS